MSRWTGRVVLIERKKFVPNGTYQIMTMKPLCCVETSDVNYVVKQCHMTLGGYVGIVLRVYWEQSGHRRINRIMGKCVVRVGGGWNWLRIVSKGRLWY